MLENIRQHQEDDLQVFGHFLEAQKKLWEVVGVSF